MKNIRKKIQPNGQTRIKSGFSSTMPVADFVMPCQMLFVAIVTCLQVCNYNKKIKTT